MVGHSPRASSNPARYRYARGERHPKSRLSDEDVRLIRELHELGLGYGEIGRKFEVSRYTVRDICRHITRG